MSPNFRRADTPEQVVELVRTRFARGDLEAVLALYDPEAVFTGSDDGPARGTAELRAAFAAIAADPPPLNVEVRSVVQADDLALVIVRWTFGPDDGPARSGHSINVMRRHAEGGWRLIIDNPAGIN